MITLSLIHWVGLFGVSLVAAALALWLSGMMTRDRPVLAHQPADDDQTFQSATVILDCAPDPIWQTDGKGEVLWRNAACVRLADETGVLPKLTASVDTSSGARPARLSIKDIKSDKARWYELRSQEFGPHRLNFATEVTQIVLAETAQRELVQTLTKTFANLTIGLAIFDKNRQLALFNPALMDLTHLPATFLTGRPDLMHFFDQLRERQVLPEPKSYASWRAQIRDAVAQASGGLYQETWSLPNSLTYRVTGRPHPDGAVAFLFEDISAEVSLTRRFRAQIELRQSVMDSMNEAIAVISQSNLVMLCNQPCNDLLKVDPDSSFADMSFHDLVSAIRKELGDSEGLRDLEEVISHKLARSERPFELGWKDGSPITGEIKNLPGGARLLIISTRADSAPAVLTGVAF